MVKAKAEGDMSQSNHPASENANTEIQITAKELNYLYMVLINSNIPSVDALFVAQLQQKLKAILNIE